MKKLIGFLLLIGIMTLSFATNTMAVPITNATEVGGFLAGIAYPDTNPDIVFSNPEHQDSLVNVNLAIDGYNSLIDPDLPTAYFWDKDETEGGRDGSIMVNSGIDYISLKWGSTSSDGGWYLWYVGDFDAGSYFDFEGLNHNLSHYSEWGSGSTPVPEPATMLLLGIGLMGIAGLGRNRKKN